MATAPSLPKRQVDTVSNAPKPTLAQDPRATGGPLLFAMLAFLVVFPWIAQLLPAQIREYIGILFR